MVVVAEAAVVGAVVGVLECSFACVPASVPALLKLRCSGYTQKGVECTI